MPSLSQLAGATRRDASPRLVLVIVCAGVVLASLDLFIVNVAIPQMARDFHVRGGGLADLSWVLNAYAIVYAACLVLFGRLADRYRRERGFLLGVAVFVAASAACGAATSVPMLIAFRVVQAAGAALLTPTSLGLILATSVPERRHGAVRAWTAVGGLAATLGPVVGGLLVEASWRWVFFVNVPIGLLALAVGWRRLPEVPGHPAPAPDALGAALITGGVGALTLGLVNGGTWGWSNGRTLAALCGSVVALGLFALHAARHRNPLVDRALFRLRPFTGASIVALFFSAAFGAPGDRGCRRRRCQRRFHHPWSWAATACCSTRPSPTPGTRCGMAWAMRWYWLRSRAGCRTWEAGYHASCTPRRPARWNGSIAHPVKLNRRH